MSDVRALRLRLTAPQGWTARVQAQTEEALRLAAADDSRLIVIRRLDLSRLPVAAHPAAWQARTAERMAVLTRAAVHAATPGAERAAAVWFASPAEARALLLGELAAGRSPTDWFWRLAVLDWNGAALPDWLAVQLTRAAREPEQLVELAQAVIRIAAAGQLAALMAALPSGAINNVPPAAGSPGARAIVETAEAPFAVHSQVQAQGLLDRLPVSVQAIIWRELQRRSPDSRAASVLVRLALVAAAPELASTAGLLRALADAVTGIRKTKPPPAAAGPPVVHKTAKLLETARLGALYKADEGGSLPAIAKSDVFQFASDQPSPVALIDATLPDYRPEQATAAAGLWLLVRPLVCIGLDDFLTARPKLAAAGFARGFLRHVAERQRIPDADPIYALLPEAVAPIDPALFAMWRIGLDRWLRRRVRRKLAAVALRRGWLSPHETGVRVRFRLDQADIALRARALDVDPGWVPWLGMAITYDYRDEARR